jgi:Beta-glucanase/Beta-glucan synthetase
MQKFNRILLILVLGYSCLGLIIFVSILHDYSLFYPVKGQWKLVWEDDFNGPILDQSKWEAQNKSTGLLNELQACTNENVTIKNSCLVIASKKEDWTGPDILNPKLAVTRHYTSGQVVTLEKNIWTYGRFEIRAKLPAGQGILPYVLLYPTDSNWPPEVVIMSMVGSQPYAAFFVNFWGTDARHQHSDSSGLIWGRQDYSADFHTFTLEWDPGELRWYVDNVFKYRAHRHIPNKPLCLVLGTTVGGVAGAPYDQKAGGRPSSFPQYFMIDRVRVYQRR